jgi:hypothetical protein
VKVTITSTETDSDPYELAGEDDTSVGSFRINGSRVLQISEFLRANHVRIRDRKNLRLTISFSVTRKHATVDECEAYVLTHAENVPGSGLVKFTTRSGSLSRFLDASAIQTVDSSYDGLTSRHSYQMIGGEMLTEKPT